MALIRCPECKKKISDQCKSCPNCGYPIDEIYIEKTNQSRDTQKTDETILKSKATTNNKHVLQKLLFGVVIGIIIVVMAVPAILLLNRDTKPKLDKDGNPVFVELTNEVYTNTDKYLGYYIEIKGKVFQVMGDSGNVKGIQVWIDPDTCEQNMIIYYNTDVEVKSGDYILCTGYIDSVTEYENAYGTKLCAPTVISADLKEATYIDVMSPTTKTITPKNLKQEKYGYSVSIDKIEFSKKETRVYATAVNNGKAILNIVDAVIVQNGKQYDSTENYEADYDKIPYELVKGASSSGIIVFPAISMYNFELTINLHSDNYDEKFKSFTFQISQNGVSNQTSNKNQEAVKSAEEIADFYATVCPRMVKELLISDYGYSETQVNYAIANANIDWKNKAINAMKEYWDSDYNVIVTETDFYNYLVYLGYDDATIEYAFNNTDGYYRGEATASEEERVKLLLSYGYTREAIVNWYSKTMDDSEAEALVDSCM